MKIVIGNKEQKSGYFEIAYTLTLDVPQLQQTAIGKMSSAIANSEVVVDNSTIDISGIIGFADGTSIDDIKTALVGKANEEQEKLDSDTRLEFAGMTYDGEAWI